MRNTHACRHLIAGAGLTGLALAARLIEAGREVLVVEARERPGGRILSEPVTADTPDMLADFGPAWIWPGQPRVAALAKRLGLALAPQFAEGRLVFEDADGSVRRDLDFAPMAGALRVGGGLAALTKGLAASIPTAHMMLGARLLGVRRSSDGVTATVHDGRETRDVQAAQLTLAMPPRIAARLDAAPDWPEAMVRSASATPTWMAGHAKLVASYDRPFWREAGLSGDAISRVGPLMEIHDAAPLDATGAERRGAAALFGFVGAPAQARDDERALKAAATDQLARLFGPSAASPRTVRLKDWARDDLTAVDADWTPPRGHPAYGPIAAFDDIWDGRVTVASSELAPTNGGLVEGALEAAERTARRLLSVSAR